MRCIQIHDPECSALVRVGVAFRSGRRSGARGRGGRVAPALLGSIDARTKGRMNLFGSIPLVYSRVVGYSRIALPLGTGGGRGGGEEVSAERFVRDRSETSDRL